MNCEDRDEDIVDYSAREEAMADWVHERGQEFANSIMSPINLAMDVVQGELDLSVVDALCFVNYRTNAYQKEVEKAFEEHLKRQREDLL
jgi:hypothetical protein